MAVFNFKNFGILRYRTITQDRITSLTWVTFWSVSVGAFKRHVSPLYHLPLQLLAPRWRQRPHSCLLFLASGRRGTWVNMGILQTLSLQLVGIGRCSQINILTYL